MTSPWKRRWKRLSQMSGDELLDRLRQHGMARVDLLRQRAGGSFSKPLQSSNSATSFFFSPGSVPRLCELLRQRFPEQAQQIILQAEKICRHQFDLLGYAGLDYGEDIDWQLDRVHQKRAPVKPWFKIRYLDFAEVGDSKVTWELNRHQHLVTLAKAYRLTGDDKFAAELFRQWGRDWHHKNPYGMGINWASSLEVGLRSLSWLWIYFLMAESPGMPPDFTERWLRSLEINGRHIETYLSTYFSPNTHLLGEAVALFFIGCLCPQLQQAQRWKERGWQLVLQEAKRQVQADGLHFEQSTYYHVYAIDLFIHSAVLASVNDIAIPSEFDRTLERMLDALCVLGRAGDPPTFGDDDGGRLFDSRRNRAEHLLDPVATGAVLFGRGDFKTVAGGLREETLWLLGEPGVEEFDRLPAKPASNASVALAAGGLYVMSGETSNEQLVVDAGMQGAMTAGHGHADALSVCLNSNGRPLLIDPGTYEYVGSGSARDDFRGTTAHNTLVVDNLSQADPKGPFGWERLPQVRAEGWISGQTFDLFLGSHDGYSRLANPVTHRRWIFSRKGRFWLIRDVAEGAGKHSLSVSWHLAPELSPDKSGSRFVHTGGKTALSALAVEGHGWSQELRDGWWSPAYGRKEKMKVLHFGTVATLPAEFVTLWQTGAAVSSAKLVKKGSESSLAAYRYSTSGEDHSMFFANRGTTWTSGVWTSDAEFLYWGASPERRLLICCHAASAMLKGHRIVSCERPVLRCEIMITEKGLDVWCSDDQAKVDGKALRNALSELDPVASNSKAGPGGTGL